MDIARSVSERLPFENPKLILEFLKDSNIQDVNKTVVDEQTRLYLVYKISKLIPEDEHKIEFIDAMKAKLLKSDMTAIGSSFIENRLKEYITEVVMLRMDKQPTTCQKEFLTKRLNVIQMNKDLERIIVDLSGAWENFKFMVEELSKSIPNFDFSSIARFLVYYADEVDFPEHDLKFYVSQWKKFGFILEEFEERVFGKEKLPSVILKPKKKATMTFVKNQLEKVNISSLNYIQMKMLVNKMVDDWNKTRVPTGKAVGTIAAQSIGERATQQSMKTVHTAGINLGKTSLGGISRIEEILEVKQCPAKPSMKFFVHNKNISSLEARVIAGQFKYITLQDLVLKAKKDKYDPKNRPVWYDIQDALFTKKKAQEKLDMHRIIFTMNTKECFMRRISFLDIMRRIQKDDNVMGSDITFYFSGKSFGEFHVLVTDTFLEEFKGQDKLEMFKNKLLQVHISGIEGVTDVFASCYNLSSMITKWEQDSDLLIPVFNQKELNRTLVSKDVVLNFVKQRTDANWNGKAFTWKGKKEDFLSELSREHVMLGNVCKIEEIGLNYVIHNPEKSLGINDLDLFAAIPVEVLVNDKNSVKVVKSSITLDELKNTLIPVKMRIDVGKYWYWETDGSNLSTMYDFDSSFVRDDGSTERIDIVYEKLTSNHIVDVSNILGIEAGKRLIIDEMLASSSDVQIGHLRELADMMTLEGFMVQVARHGFVNLDNDFLSKISFEENTKQYHISAAMGMKDNIDNIDSAIITGNLVPVGVVKSEERKKEDQKAEKVMNMINNIKPKMTIRRPVVKKKEEKPSVREEIPEQKGTFIDV